jgi:hypothetical protein
VRDQSGALVKGATVTARNPATITSKSTTTNDDGSYLIVQLTPGDYEVTVEATNFKKLVLPAVTLTVGQRADLDVTLEVGTGKRGRYYHGCEHGTCRDFQNRGSHDSRINNV